MDAAVMIAIGITGPPKRRPLAPSMQDAVCAAPAGEQADALVELRTRK
jgi:hypothetical protein